MWFGINTGPAVAGVVGQHNFHYDVWGDAVNTATRMESTGEPGRIQISDATYALVRGGPGNLHSGISGIAA
jgi:adenylate cyclase